jgi:acetolactate synthase-1/2/3 large subunit
MAVADGADARIGPAVCVVSRGPGLSNAMIGLHTAFHDAQPPLVVLIGQVERKDFRPPRAAGAELLEAARRRARRT